MDPTPVTLLERLRLPGQRQAWDQFVTLYTPLLLYWARRLEPQTHDAADLVQDVFTTLVRKLPGFTYQPGRRFRGWLWTVLLNRWRDRRKRVPALRGAPGAVLDGPADPEGLEELWDREHNRFLARRALEVMRRDFEETTWKAVWLFVVEGRPAAAVAAELGLTENAVYVAKCRVLRRLRRELAGLVE